MLSNDTKNAISMKPTKRALFPDSVTYVLNILSHVVEFVNIFSNLASFVKFSKNYSHTKGQNSIVISISLFYGNLLVHGVVG